MNENELVYQKIKSLKKTSQFLLNMKNDLIKKLEEKNKSD